MESLILQPNGHSCGPAVVVNAVALLGGHADYKEVVRLARTSKGGTTWTGLFRAFDGLGYRTAEYQTNTKRYAWEFLKRWSHKSPIVAWLSANDHYVVIAGVSDGLVTVVDSDRAQAGTEAGVKVYKRSEWLDVWPHRGLYECIRIWPGPSH